MQKLIKILSAALVITVVYVAGAYFYPYTMWSIVHPQPQPIHSPSQPTLVGHYDGFGRLIGYAGKEEVSCPVQIKDTGVLLVAGQSNSANHALHKFTTSYPKKVINYFNGKCYVAGSPLLGATYEAGEFITPLADSLINSGTYKSVVIIASGIGGTAINRWQRGGDLNGMLLKVVEQAERQYKITDVLWAQGENDYYVNKTSQKDYFEAFHSLEDTLQEKGINAPFFIAVATRCGPVAKWQKDNPVSMAQHQLIDNKRIFLGADTDTLISDKDRAGDSCHFAESGEMKVATTFGSAISAYHKSH